MLNTGKLFHFLKFPVLALAAALSLAGCNLPTTRLAPTLIPPLDLPTALPFSLPPSQQPTAIVIPPTSAPASTNTSIPPTEFPTALPTALPPQPTAIPGAIRINFATGATAGVIEKEIQPGQVINYLVGASADQPLIISTGSANNDVTFSVTGLSNGRVLLDASQKANSWQTMLTATQDYLVQVHAGASTELFTLNVITPARVKFDLGSDTTLIHGSTPGGWNVSYILRASAGQRIDMNLYNPDGNAVLSMYGYQDGNPYLRYAAEQTTFGMILPSTQDYIIQVVPRAGEVATYSLGITIN